MLNQRPDINKHEFVHISPCKAKDFDISTYSKLHILHWNLDRNKNNKTSFHEVSNFIRNINTMLCPFKVKGNTFEFTVHTYCYSV